jgi:hypothetical protein
LTRYKQEGHVWSASLFVILLERVETEILFAMETSMFKTKMDIDRHGPRLMHNNCKILTHLISLYQLPLNGGGTPVVGASYVFNQNGANLNLTPKDVSNAR